MKARMKKKERGKEAKKETRNKTNLFFIPSLPFLYCVLPLFSPGHDSLITRHHAEQVTGEKNK